MRLSLLLLIYLQQTYAASYYASTSGGGGENNGSIGQPWRLRYALADSGGVIGAGDTLYIRAGTYAIGSTSYAVACGGTNGNPVVIRNYPNERATILCNNYGTVGFAIRGTADYCWVWGIEFVGAPTDTNRTTGAGIGNAVGIYSGDGGVVGFKLINCLIHECGPRRSEPGSRTPSSRA